MAQGKYKYTGINQDGKKVEGEIEGKDIRTVKLALRRKGIRVRKLVEPSLLDIDLGTLMVEKGLAKPFGMDELNRFTKQLTILIDAGVPILESLEILAKQEKNIALKSTIKSIVEEIGQGKSLHDAMVGKKGFSKLYTALIKAGEAAGILDTILAKLSEFMEKQEAIKKKIKSAMTYPTIVVIIGVGVTWGLMVFVVPQFVGMLQESNQEIPGVTQFVIDVSDFFQEYTLVMGVFLGVSLFAFSQFKQTKNGKIA